MIFTSHDRAFMQAVATTVIEVKDGGVVDHLGDYDTYVAKVTGEIDAAEAGGRAGGPRRLRRGGKATAAAEAEPAATSGRPARRWPTSKRRSPGSTPKRRSGRRRLLAATDPAEALGSTRR